MDQSQSYLFPEEQSIVQGVTSSQRSLLQRLYTPNLSQYKNDIVGLRAEEFFFFLRSIQEGRLPTTGNKVMFKCNGGIYLTPNPDSHVLNQCTDGLVRKVAQGSVDFGEAAEHTVGTYYYVAQMNPLIREVRPYIHNESELVDKWTEDKKDPTKTENFYQALIDEILTGRADFNHRYRFPIHFLLKEHIQPEDRDGVLNILRKLAQRAGIIIGFNDLLVSRYGMPKVGDGTDIFFNIPQGFVDLDCIVGFEVLGDFEEGIVNRILNAP